jgi:hypothetical protein
LSKGCLGIMDEQSLHRTGILEYNCEISNINDT